MTHAHFFRSKTKRNYHKICQARKTTISSTSLIRKRLQGYHCESSIVILQSQVLHLLKKNITIHKNSELKKLIKRLMKKYSLIANIFNQFSDDMCSVFHLFRRHVQRFSPFQTTCTALSTFSL